MEVGETFIAVLSQQGGATEGSPTRVFEKGWRL